MGIVSDSAPLWSLPTSLMTSSKGDGTSNAFSRSEHSKSRKKSCSEGNEDGPTPKPKKSQAGLSSIARKTLSSKSNENTSKQSKRSTQRLPVLKYSGQSSRLCASSASQSVADSLLTAVSP